MSTTTTDDEHALATVPQRTPIDIGARGIEISTLAELGRFAAIVYESGLAPESLDTVQKIILALEMGLELGFRPMMALQNIGVINGRAGIYGDAAKALCEASGLMVDYKQDYAGTIEGGDRKSIVTSWRRGRKHPIITEYSIDDAKRAELWGKMTKNGKPTPWVTAPDRMLMFRARGFNLRDNFPDVMKGFRTYEELNDYSTDEADHSTRIKRAKPAKIVEPKFATEQTQTAPEYDPRHDDSQKTLFPQTPKTETAKREKTETPKQREVDTTSPPVETVVPSPPPAVSAEAPKGPSPSELARTRLRSNLLALGKTTDDFVALCVEREAIDGPMSFDELEDDLINFALQKWQDVSAALSVK